MNGTFVALASRLTELPHRKPVPSDDQARNAINSIMSEVIQLYKVMADAGREGFNPALVRLTYTGDPTRDQALLLTDDCGAPRFLNIIAELQNRCPDQVPPNPAEESNPYLTSAPDHLQKPIEQFPLDRWRERANKYAQVVKLLADLAGEIDTTPKTVDRLSSAQLKDVSVANASMFSAIMKGIRDIRQRWRDGVENPLNAATLIGDLLLKALDAGADVQDMAYAQDVRQSANRNRIGPEGVRQNAELPGGCHAFVRAAYLLMNETASFPFIQNEDVYREQGVDVLLNWLERACSSPARRIDKGKQGVSFDEATLAELRNPAPTHSPDFTSVVWYGTRYTFAKGNQAEVVRFLWEAWESGGHSLSQETIGARVAPTSERFELSKVFRSRKQFKRGYEPHPAWGTMIQTAGKGSFQLVRPNKEA